MEKRRWDMLSEDELSEGATREVTFHTASEKDIESGSNVGTKQNSHQEETADDVSTMISTDQFLLLLTTINKVTATSTRVVKRKLEVFCQRFDRMPQRRLPRDPVVSLLALRGRAMKTSLMQRRS